jgi:hypothetical protein
MMCWYISDKLESIWTEEVMTSEYFHVVSLEGLSKTTKTLGYLVSGPRIKPSAFWIYI